MDDLQDQTDESSEALEGFFSRPLAFFLPAKKQDDQDHSLDLAASDFLLGC